MKAKTKFSKLVFLSAAVAPFLLATACATKITDANINKDVSNKQAIEIGTKLGGNATLDAINKLQKEIFAIKEKIDKNLVSYLHNYENFNVEDSKIQTLNQEIANRKPQIETLQREIDLDNNEFKTKLTQTARLVDKKNNKQVGIFNALSQRIAIDANELDDPSINSNLKAALTTINEDNKVYLTKNKELSDLIEEQNKAQDDLVINQSSRSRRFVTLSRIADQVRSAESEIIAKQNQLFDLSKNRSNVVDEIIAKINDQLKPLPDNPDTPSQPEPTPPAPTPSPSPTPNPTPSPVPQPTPTPTPPSPQPPVRPNPPSQPEPTPPTPTPSPNPEPQPPTPGIPPTLPPGFFDPGRLYKAQNTYPEYVSDFEPAKISPEQIYKEIYDRTFSVKYSKREAGSNLEIKDLGQGTAWLLDYHNSSDGNNYKLFFATNLHVLEQFSNSLDDELNKKLNYEDPSGDKVTGISLGKTMNVPKSFAAIPNNSAVENIAERGGSIHYENSSATGFKNPKIIFAGYDFIDKSIYENDPKQANLREQYKSNLQQKINDYNAIVGASQDEINTRNRYQKSIDFLEKNQYIPYYTDFAVFEVEVNLSTANDIIKNWVKKAVQAVDNYIARNNQSTTNPALPNQAKELLNSPFLNIDYFSAGKSEELPSVYDRYKSKLLSNAKDLYIAGYPANNSGSPYWMQNNPTERNGSSTNYFLSPPNNEAFAYATNNAETKINAGNATLYTPVWNRPLIENYGVQYNIRFSSLFFGASGSVVYNEFGQIVGIYNSVSSSVKFGNLLANGGYASLVQAANLKSATEPENQYRTIYAYNLIDGTNKTLYPKQTKSYRQNLKVIYPNGFGDNSKKTALFPEGF